MFRSDIEFTIDVADDQTFEYFSIFRSTQEKYGFYAPLSFNERWNRKLFERLWNNNLKHQVGPGRYRVTTVRNCLNFSAMLHTTWF